MRLLDNSNTRNLFESLKESYGCESYEQAAEQAAEEMFDAMTDDIFLNNTSCVQDGDVIKVTLNVTAYGYNGEDEDDMEMNRDVTFTIPLDYTSDGEDMSIDEFYEAISELIKEWIAEHSSPDNFYEGIEEKKEEKLDESVMINTGSTTVTSDETGVVIEDNGNTITTGNGVTVNIDNEADVLPNDMDISEPVDEIPADVIEDVPAEDIENVEPVEELPEEPVEEPTEDDDDEDDEDADVDESEDINESTSFDSIVLDSYNHLTNDLGKTPTIDDIVDDILNSYDQDYINDNTPEDSLQAFKDVKYVLRHNNLDFKDLDESVEDKKEGLDEAIDKDGGPFPYLMKHGQGPRTLPDDVEIVKYGESSNDKDIVYLNKVLTAEEEAKYDMKPMEKLEDCDTKPIKEADGYNQNQNVEIYQNPEFDYQILDITELDNTDTGDVRAIDMANILNDLDESLTEALGTNNWGEINSFLTRKGTHKKTNESYSSAILELTLPRLNESVGEYKNVFMLEVYGDGAIKECVVRDSKSHIIKEYSGKSKDPVKHFEGVIYDIMNSRKLTEAIELMVNEPEKEDNINFANSKAVDKDKERQEKHLKQHNDRNKESKKFKVEKEPDQDNTTGKTEEEATDTTEVEALPKAKKTKVDAKKLKVKEIKKSAKLTEAEDELLDEPIVTDGSEPEDELEESGSDVAIFHRKPKSVDAMRAAEQNGITVNKSNYKIIGTKELSADEFNKFANNLSSEEYEWLKEYNDTSNSGEFKCVEVINTEDDSYSILVDPQGYNYARYAAIKENLSSEEGLLDEPTEEEVNNEE